MATSPLHSRGPTSGNCYVTPVYSGAPRRGDKIKSSTPPLPYWGPASGRNCDVPAVFSRAARRGDKTKSGYITPIFLAAQKWVKLLRNPCIRGCINLAPSGPKSGRNCYVAHAFPGVPKAGEKM